MPHLAHDVTDDCVEGHNRGGPTPTFVFVGQRRSALAIARGVRWEDGRLAARTLHAGLRALGLESGAQIFLSLFPDGESGVVDPDALGRVRALAERGMIVAAMGRPVRHRPPTST